MASSPNSRCQHQHRRQRTVVFPTPKSRLRMKRLMMLLAMILPFVAGSFAQQSTESCQNPNRIGGPNRVAVLRNGSSVCHDRLEIIGGVARLHMMDGHSVEIPVAEISAFKNGPWPRPSHSQCATMEALMSVPPAGKTIAGLSTRGILSLSSDMQDCIEDFESDFPARDILKMRLIEEAAHDKAEERLLGYISGSCLEEKVGNQWFTDGEK